MDKSFIIIFCTYSSKTLLPTFVTTSIFHFRCASIPESHFVEESDLDNCNTEKIIKNRFHDPLLSSESEDETPAKINWDEMFRTRKVCILLENNLDLPLTLAVCYLKVSLVRNDMQYSFSIL